MNMSIKNKALPVAISCLLTSTAIPVSAQMMLEEITVTSRKVSENLQEVPVSVSAFNSDSLMSKGINDVSQVGDFAPGVTLDFTTGLSGASNSLTAYIRGIGQPDFALNFEPGVGTYVDGVYLARSVGSVVELLDVERIEILKGPQGTLFGRNTIGGAINIVTARPSDEFGFKSEVTTGKFNRIDVKATMDLPLVSDKLLSSFSVSSKNRDGYVDRIPFTGEGAEDTNSFIDRLTDSVADRSTEALGNSNSDTIRGKLLWLVDDNVEITFSGDYTRTRETSSGSTLLRTIPDSLSGLYNACIAGMGPPPACGPLNGVNVDADPNNDMTPYDDRFLTGDIDKTYGDDFGYSNLDAWGLSAELNWDIGDSLNFKSITAFRDLEAAFARDPDGSPITIDGPNFEMIQDQFSQEFQLTGLSFNDNLKWLLGAYYFKEEGTMTDLVPLGEGLLQIYGPNEIEAESYAAFANFTYNITDRLSTSFGVRYTEEDKQLYGAQRDLNALPSKLGLPPELHPDPNDLTLFFPPELLTEQFENTSVKLGLEYAWTDDLFGYMSYSQGYKSGGWPTRLTDPALEVPGFDEETADAYEVGVKSEWFDNKLRLNAAAFYTEYNDLQLTVLRGIAPFTQNGGNAEIQGLELDFQALVSERLSISGGVALIDAEYVELSPGSVVSLDDDLMNLPEVSTNLSLDYSLPLDSGAELNWHIDHIYKSEVANDPQNSPLLIEDSTSVLNASVTFVSSKHWEVGLGIRNITDERYIVAGFDQPAVGYTEATYSRPREWWLSLRYNY